MTTILVTRGSPLALAQAHLVLAQCRSTFPERAFTIRTVKTTGDKRQRASMAKPDAHLPKGLFTKELENALLDGTADLAVHSLKDLPTDLPEGLILGAVLEREDPRDVLVYRGNGSQQRRGFPSGLRVRDLPANTVVATSSTRRREQLLRANPHLRIVEIRGNVGTRLRRLADDPGLDATILAMAGLRRLGYEVQSDAALSTASPEGDGPVVPHGLLASILTFDEMLPCVGQAAIGIEIRRSNDDAAAICSRINHQPTMACVRAERAFLHGIGGGCQSPVAAYAEAEGAILRMRAISFRTKIAVEVVASGDPVKPVELGLSLAGRLKDLESRPVNPRSSSR